MKKIDYECAAFTAPKPLLRDVRKKAKKLHGKRGFSKHVAGVLQADLNGNKARTPAR